MPEFAERLSPVERQLLQYIAQGHSNKAIAKQLQITELMVKSHAARILQKLSVAAKT